MKIVQKHSHRFLSMGPGKTVGVFWHALRQIGRTIRWRDWAPGKVPVFCAALLYAGLSNHRGPEWFVPDFVLFIIFITFQAGLGYIINDWGDREIDLQQGKPNAFRNLSRNQGSAALAALTVLSIASGLPFAGRSMFLPLWLCLVLCSAAYSLKPLRLKEQGSWGVCAATAAQWPLPVLLGFAVMGRLGGWDMAVWTMAVTLSGCTLEIAHQRFDRLRDSGTHTGTMAVRMQAIRLDRVFAIALLLDKFSIGAIVLTILIGLHHLRFPGKLFLPGIPLIGIYLGLFVLSLFEAKRSEGGVLDPYYGSGRSASKFLHETVGNLVIPLYLILLAIPAGAANSFLVPIFLFWRLILGRANMRWPFQRFMKKKAI